MNRMNQKYTSASTSINSSKPPAVFKKGLQLGFFKFGETCIDIGGGRFDTFTDALATVGVENNIYDPFNRDAKHNEAVIEKGGSYDVAVISNVLNVIMEESIRSCAISLAKQCLKPDGVLLVYIYEGNKTGIGEQSQADAWQENRKAKDYITEIENHFRDVKIKYGVIYARN